jgi:hypothetical protein
MTKILPEDGAIGAKTCRRVLVYVCMMYFTVYVRFVGVLKTWLPVSYLVICVKNQQMHQLFIQFINYVW